MKPWFMLTPSFTSARNIEHKKAHVEVRRRLPLTKDFGLIWLSQLVSQVGDGISKLALLWFVYSITGSPLKTTAIGLLQTIPPIVCGPLIGVLWTGCRKNSCSSVRMCSEPY